MRRRWIKGTLLGLLIGLGGAVLGLSSLGTSFELNVGKAWLFNVRGEIPGPANIVIVGINGQTSEQLGLPGSPRDWPRSIHAKLIKRLVEFGATVIAFDVYFKKPKRVEDDNALASEIKKSGRVLLVEKLTGRRQPITDMQGRNLGMVWVEELLAPKKEFSQSAVGLAPFPLPKIDAAVHDFWSFKTTAGNAATMPALAMQTYELSSLPKLIALIKQTHVSGSELLPDKAIKPGTDNQVGKLMIRLRTLYVKNSGLGDEVKVLIQHQYNKSQSAETKNKLIALNNLYRGKQQRFINFYGAPGTITTIPFQSIIKGEDPNLKKGTLDLHNKIVFIGFSDLYDPGQPDRFYSVFTNDNGVDLSGVEVMATACGNLMSDEALKPLSLRQTGIILLIFGFCMGLLIYQLPAIAGVPVSIALAVLYAVGAQWGFDSYQVWMPMATPMLAQFPLALFLGLMGQYFLERRRGKQIKETLSYYVPDTVVRDLTENRLDPGSANKVVYSTCLATDMAGFSTLAETMPPGELAVVLNDYFDTLAQPLKKHLVDVTEFRADAIMCAWTSKEHDIEVRRKAVMAALDAVKAIDKFKERYSNVNTNIRIGLESGTVYVGHAGGGGHFVFSIVGDCANTASRVESLNKHLKTNLLATGSVIEGIDNLLVRKLSHFQFVGKTEALPITEIIATKDTANQEQIDFCDQFAEAIRLFHAGRWDKAQLEFVHFLEKYPDDGPTQFYLNWCHQYISGEAETDEPHVIRMQAK